MPLPDLKDPKKGAVERVLRVITQDLLKGHNMSDQVRVPKVVILEQNGIVKTRCVRKIAAPAKYAPHLQGILMLEGPKALRQVGMKWFQGFVVKEV